MEDKAVLVSVCVFAYNSAETVIETLDSVLKQTYPRLELIVSDDCSTDNTVELCRKWLAENGDRFEHTILLTHELNGGVAKNINSCVEAASGEWIKQIAGDDILLPDCVSHNMEYVLNNDNDGIVFSKIQLFRTGDDGKREMMDYFMPNPRVIDCYSMTPEEQYSCLLRVCFTPAVSVFYNRSLALEYPYPEQYRYCEDWPQWLHLTKNGIRLKYFDAITALYRVGNTLSHAHRSHFINSKYHQTMTAFFYAERFPALIGTDPQTARGQQKEFFLGEVAVVLLKNRRNIFTRAILFLFKMLVGTRKIA